MPDPLFKIDGAPAPGVGEDTRHNPVPGPLSARRVEGFVGDPSRYIIKGEVLPQSWRITGVLLADTFGAMHTLIADYAAMRGDITPHQITIHGTNYEAADLAEFAVIGEIHAYQSPDVVPGPGARVSFRMLWELLS